MMQDRVIKIYYLMVKTAFLFFFIFKISTTSAQVSKSRLYLGIDDYGVKAKNHFKSIGNKNVRVLTENRMYPGPVFPGEEAKINDTIFSKYVEEVFPDKLTKGIGVLNWEGRSFDLLLMLPETSDVYKKVFAEFLKGIKIAKKLRPNISWGYYGIPFKRGNFESNADWLAGNKKIAELLKECDIFCPNIYGYTPTNLGNISDVKESIKLGLLYKKKVFAFVWHRYNGASNGKYEFDLIPKNKFVKYTTDILRTRYNDKRVDGVIWWGLDTYFFKQEVKSLVREAPDIDSFVNKYDRLIIDYTKAIIKANKN